MNISGTSHVHGPHGINAPHGPHANRATRQATSTQATGDQVDISAAAEAASQVAESGDVRHDVVARVRAEIAAGTYETPDKLDAAVDRLLDELG